MFIKVDYYRITKAAILSHTASVVLKKPCSKFYLLLLLSDKRQITDEEFVNAFFEPQEQVNEIQANLLGAAFELAIGGPAQAHVGTGSGGSSSELPWGEQKNKRTQRNR